MSFGFSVGDFVTVGGLCWKLYKKCKDSPGNYRQLTSEVGALYKVIKETEELLSQQDLNVQQKEKLRVATVGCGEVLQDLDDLLARYGRMGTKSQRAIDRVGFGVEDIDGIRTRLISNVTLLDAFNNASSNARLEEKLNILIAEIRSGKRGGSAISVQTVDSITRNDQEAWDAFRKELEDVGVSSSIIAEKRQFLIVWFQEAVAAGKLEEEIPEHEGKEDNNDPLEQSASAQSGVGRRADHESYASDSIREQVFGHRQIDRSVLFTQQRSSIDSTGSDGTPIDLGGLAIAEPKEDHQMWPLPLLPLQLPSSNKDLNYRSDRDDMTSSEGSQHVTLGEVTDPHIHSNATGPQRDKDSKRQKNKKSRLSVSYVLSRLRSPNEDLRPPKEDLFEAVRSGNLVRVETALKHSNDVHVIEGDFNESALHVATMEGMTKVVSVLLLHGHQVDFPDSRGYTSLHQAALNDGVEIAKILIQCRAKLERRLHDSEETPLHLASRRKAVSTARLLLEHGASIQAKDYRGNSPLHLAFDECTDTEDSHTRKCLATARVLIEKGADIDAVNMSGDTALHRAVYEGPQDAVQFLLERVDIQKKMYNIKETPLHAAAKGGRHYVVSLLLEKGADGNAKNSHETTPLHIAAHYGHEEVIRLLLDKGAEIHEKDSDEKTSLHMAARNGHHQTVVILLDKGAKVNTTDRYWETPLAGAAEGGEERIVTLLLAKGADPDTTNRWGETASYLAMKKGHPSIARLLDAAPRSP